MGTEQLISSHRKVFLEIAISKGFIILDENILKIINILTRNTE